MPSSKIPRKSLTATAISAAMLILACVVLPSLTVARSTAVAELRGNVTECWEGKPRTVSGLRVYVLAMPESQHIRAVLDRMQKMSSSDADFVGKFNEAFDELVSDLKALHGPSGLAKTDASGHFLVGKLHPGEKYLVLAIDWDKGDSDELAYYRQLTTKELPPGTTVISIYMGPGHESDCGKQ